MLKLFKNFFLANTHKNKVRVFLLFFVILGLILPFSCVQAGWIADLAINIVTGFYGLSLQIFVIISNIIFGIAALLLGWVLSPSFIGVKFTDNPFVNIGWTLTRDLANMGFIIVLVAIGLGTALRIGEYTAKKTIPWLIIIALLINFTPVICGLIIDATNIIMNFFIGEMTGLKAFKHVFEMQGAALLAFFKGLVFLKPGAGNELIIRSITLVALNVGAAIVFLLFAVLFVARYIALWLLVILSPLAFFCYILPATRSVFKTWWHQFIQWTVIGVVAGFFLYLAEQMMVLTVDNKLKVGGVPPEQIAGTSPAGWLDGILPYGIILALLYIGFLVTISTSAAGADKVISLSTKGGKIAGAWAGKQTLGRLLTHKKGRKLMEKAAKTKLGFPETFREFKKAPLWKKAAMVVGAPIAYPSRWAIRIGAKAGLEYGAKQPRYIEEKQKELEKKFGKDYEAAAASYSSILPTDWQGKIAMGLHLAKTKGAKALKALTEEQRREVIKLTARYNPAQLEDVVKHMPELIDERGKSGEDEKIAKTIQETLVSKGPEDEDVKGLIKIGIKEADAIRKAAFKKAADAMKNADVENMTLETFKNKEFQEATVRFKPVSFIRKIGEEKGQEFLDLIHQRAEAKELGAKEIAKTNATLLRSSITNAGFGAVFESLPGAKTTNQLDAFIKEVRAKMLSDDQVEEIVRRMKEERETGEERTKPLRVWEVLRKKGKKE